MPNNAGQIDQYDNVIPPGELNGVILAAPMSVCCIEDRGGEPSLSVVTMQANFGLLHTFGIVLPTAVAEAMRGHTMSLEFKVRIVDGKLILPSEVKVPGYSDDPWRRCVRA